MIKEQLKVTIKAQEAKPTPPIGPMLGQRGLNIKEFCDLFNNQTKKFKKGIPINTLITIEKNNKFQLLPYNQSVYEYFKLINKKKINVKYIYEIASYLIEHDNRYKNIEIIQICKLLLSSSLSTKIVIY